MLADSKKKIGEVKGRWADRKKDWRGKGSGGWGQCGVIRAYLICEGYEDCLSSSAILEALKLKLKSSAVGMEPKK